MAPLVVIVGETASGKSALALELAKQFNGELICADSRTIYSGMGIGTAKPTKVEQKEIPHHLLDIRMPDQKFTVADFKKLANEAIEDISKKRKLPILVGGTGLYIDSIIFDYQFSEATSERDPHNPRHLKQTKQTPKELRANTLIIGLDIPKETLKERIEKRVEHMWQAGLADEAEELAKTYGWDNQLLQTIGYKEFKSYFEGQKSAEETRAEIILNTIHYAKRQCTWFKRNQDINWFGDGASARACAMNWLMENKKIGQKTIKAIEP